MIEAINYLEKKLKKNDIIVIGVSSGPDSMCLLHILLNLKEKLNLTIICAHVNHNVRKESKEEAIFVEDYAKKNNCLFEYLKIEHYENDNFEATARKKRYTFYETLINKYNANYLMTAHHGDDLVETILMRLTRGSNLNGYAGFKKETELINYQLLRPLINNTKEEILEYNKHNNIIYYIDKTNSDEKYTRNRYRLNLLPVLKKENKNVHQKFLKFSEQISEIEEFLKKETEKSLTKVLEFDKVNLHEFNKLELMLKKRVIEYFLKIEYQNEINNLNGMHVTKILELSDNKKANASINLPGKKVLIKSYSYLYFKKNEEILLKKRILQDNLEINKNEKIVMIDSCDINKSNYILRLNSNEITLPLYVRTRESKDILDVKNLQGKKKVKDIFINEKIPLDKRDSWPIVVDSNDNVLWVPGIKKSKFDKNIDEFYDIIYKYVISEEKLDTYDE